jgi:LmbE family N-acetylglucosaminyl deacetylase
MAENRRVLAIMPHPDDIEILCGGTLVRLVERGYEVHACTMTAGDKGSATLSGPEIAAVRRAEAAGAARTLGAASYTCLEFDDLAIVFDNESRRRVAAQMRRIDPRLVITTPPVDYMFDHEITSHLVRDACFNAAVPNYETPGDAKPTGAIPYLYYSDPIGGHDLFGQPATTGLLVNITVTIERKSEALGCHRSQRDWLQKQHGLDDYVESMQCWCAERGALIGVGYAEGFRQHLGHPHPTDDLLGAILDVHRSEHGTS